MTKTILITRPTHQSEPLVTALSALGYSCIQLPCLNIQTQILSLHPNEFSTYDLLIFTSANAVTPEIPYKTITQPVLAVGPSTAQALEKKGVSTVIVAKNYNASGLLSLPALTHITDKTVALFTGKNPKDTLQKTLKERGANVIIHHCYERLLAQYNAAKIKSITQATLAAIIITSHETLNALITLFKAHHAWLIDQKIIAGTAELKDTAKSLGFQSAQAAKSPYTSDIEAFLRKNPL